MSQIKQLLQLHQQGKGIKFIARGDQQEYGENVSLLSRYAHKVAISNHRVLEVGGQTVKFQYKDYSDHNKVKVMALPTGEFIRRFGQHILPRGFVKMRHYGILGITLS